MPFRPTRRRLIGSAGAMLAVGASAGSRAAVTSFSWDMLQARARDLAQRPYAPPPPSAAGLSRVNYDALNKLQFRAEAQIWRGNGAVRFFPLNANARDAVGIAIVDRGQARDFAFARALFSSADALPPGTGGFSGFRLMDAGGNSDWLAFQGASYFRAAGPLDQYGPSARGLAIDTGLGVPEEFPRFTHFWLEQGPADAVTVYALLDSPSAAGAWRFVNRRTPQGVTQDVTMTVQLRKDVARLGLAPLTSMFWYGEGTRDKAVDWRPEIHDSDGLAMLTGAGERIWRPLANPPRAITNSFADRDPRGFGLLQRDRSFDHYQDDGVFYEKRPSLWVEPQGSWGAGAVTLFEIPTARETFDNIVAFWTPAAPARRGAKYALAYRLHWIADEPAPPQVARTVDCWRGVAGRPGLDPLPDATRLVADFAGPALAGLGRASGVEPIVSLSSGKPISIAAYPVVGTTARWRMIVDVAFERGETIDLRGYLRRGGTALTETLLYQFA